MFCITLSFRASASAISSPSRMVLHSGALDKGISYIFVVLAIKCGLPSCFNPSIRTTEAMSYLGFADFQTEGGV